MLPGFSLAQVPGASVNNVAAGLTLADTPADSVTNTATWTAYNAGPTGPATASASTTVTVLFPADVRGTLAVSPTASEAGPVFVEGGPARYTVRLENVGPGEQGDNAGDEFSLPLPSTLAIESLSASSGTISSDGGLVSWNGTIAPGGEVVLSILARIADDAGGQTIEARGLVRYDGNGDGVNNATRLTDDPATADPTAFEVQRLLRPAQPIHAIVPAVRRQPSSSSRERPPATPACGSCALDAGRLRRHSGATVP